MLTMVLHPRWSAHLWPQNTLFPFYFEQQCIMYLYSPLTLNVALLILWYAAIDESNIFEYSWWLVMFSCAPSCILNWWWRLMSRVIHLSHPRHPRPRKYYQHTHHPASWFRCYSNPLWTKCVMCCSVSGKLWPIWMDIAPRIDISN